MRRWTIIDNVVERQELTADFASCVVPLGRKKSLLVDSKYLNAYLTNDLTGGKWERIQAPSTYRCGAVGIKKSTKALLIGGRDEYSVLDTVEAYDTMTGQWLTEKPLSRPVWLPAVVRSSLTSQVYIVGGESENGIRLKCLQIIGYDGSWSVSKNVLDEHDWMISGCEHNGNMILSLSNDIVRLFSEQNSFQFQTEKMQISPTSCSDSMISWKQYVAVVRWKKVWLVDVEKKEDIALPDLPVEGDIMRSFLTVV